MTQNRPYNPLDKRNLGASVGEALLERPTARLGDLRPFDGAGIYAIYYTGDFSAYAPISKRNAKGKFEWPIYVGKAVPPGARKGNVGIDEAPGRVLFQRLKEHAESIEAVKNLSMSDFHCRYLIVDDIWIPLGESLLIAKFSPIWNKLIDGFGNHDPGKGRYQGMRPRWDVLHPGRGWAAKCAERPETSEQIAADVESYLRNVTIPADPKLLAPE